jgi:hypothetical protein
MPEHEQTTQAAKPSNGLWARATRDGDCIDILLTNFVATGAPARAVQVDLNGSLPKSHGPLTTNLATLDGSSTSLANAKYVQLAPHNSLNVPIAAQSVARLLIGCALS